MGRLQAQAEYEEKQAKQIRVVGLLTSHWPWEQSGWERTNSRTQATNILLQIFHHFILI